MKQDPVLTMYARVLAFYETNKKYISYAITAVVVIAIASVVYVNNRKAGNEKAAAELGKVLHLFDGGQYQQAIDGVPEQGIIGLKSIVDNYSGESAEMARFYLGNSYYMLAKYDEALEQFDDFSGSDPILSASAYAGMASCYEAKQNYSSAAKYYEKAFDAVPKAPVAAEYLSHAAYNHGLGGDKAKAVAMYKRLKKEFQQSAAARDADRFISQFSM